MTNETLDPTAATETTDLMLTMGSITGTLERPKSLDKNDLAGTEDIGANDIRLPRLAIAQGLSPQMTPGDPQFIEGLPMFSMFNDLTSEIYGHGPLTFVVVQRDERRIEFIPRNEGGGVADMDVPKGDPRLLWTRDEESGEKEPPRATNFVEFVILLLRPNKAPEPIVLSIKGTNAAFRRASDQLTTFIKLRNAAIYAGLYTVDTKAPAKNKTGQTFGAPTVKNAGFIPLDNRDGTPNEAGRALLAYAKEFHESLKGKNIIVDRDGADDPATDFDPAELEGQGRTNPGM